MRDNNFEELLQNASPEEQAMLREARQLREYVYGDPEARNAYLRAYKKKHPDAVIPELDAADKVRAEIEAGIKPFREEFDGLKKEREAEKAGAFWTGVRSKARDGGVEFEDVQKLMTEQGISNPEVAVAYLKAQVQKPAEKIMEEFGVQLPGASEEEKGLLEDPRGWQRRKAAETISAFKRAAQE